jgi:hypothetical protein
MILMRSVMSSVPMVSFMHVKLKAQKNSDIFLYNFTIFIQARIRMVQNLLSLEIQIHKATNETIF